MPLPTSASLLKTAASIGLFVVGVVPLASGQTSGQTAPVANPDTATVAAKGSVVIDVLANDIGAEGATIETNVDPRPGNGWLKVDQTAGTITFTPYSGRLNTDSFAYQLRVPGVGTSKTIVTITVGDSESATPKTATAPSAATNTAPIADAGSDQSVTRGQNVTLNATGSTDSDGSIASYAWSYGGSLFATGPSPVLNNLSSGIYTLTLRVIDNEGAANTDKVTITVDEQAKQTTSAEPLAANAALATTGSSNIKQSTNSATSSTTSDAKASNASLIADAGNSQTIRQGEAVTLDATASRDSDGSVANYIWSRANGDFIARGPIASVVGLWEGEHTINLTVTNNEGATANDTVVISVSAPPPNGVLQALADEASVSVTSDGSASVPIYFGANDLGNFDPGTFYLVSQGSDGTDAKGTLNTSKIAGGLVTYTPDISSLLEPTKDYFTYGIVDKRGNKSEAKVTINLLPPVAPVDCEAVNSKNKAISLALIGNSLMNEIQAKLNKLLVCKGFTSEIGASNPGGYRLHLHETNQKTIDLIAKGYDLTLIQEQSSGIITHEAPYEIIASLKSKIEATGSEMGLYQTWGLKDREPVKTEAILSSYETIADFFNAPIVRIGRTFDYFYTLHRESPPFTLYFDYAHPTQHGKALISYALYAYLTGESPLDTPYLGLSKEDAQLLQTVAWDSYQANR